MSDERQRLLDHSAFLVAPRDRLVCATIIRPDTAADLAPDVVVQPLLPHDAELLLERSRPDLVLVESRAVTAGHPWAGAGEPSVVDPTLRLRDALDTARAHGVPTVLWWNDLGAETPGLIPFERHFDFVISAGGTAPTAEMTWSPGVQLARFGALPDGGERRARPAWHARWDQMPPRRLRMAMERATGGADRQRPELWIDADITARPAWVPPRYAGEPVLRIESTRLGEAYRARSVFIGEGFLATGRAGDVPPSTLRQLAAGARVVSTRDARLDDAVGPWIDWVADSDDIFAMLAGDLATQARAPDDQRALLRRLFLDLDTTASVARLAALIGLPTETPRRDVCVVASLDEAVDPRAIVDSVTAQQHRPVEALLVGGDAATAARATGELGLVGIRSRHLPSHTLGGGPAVSAAAFSSAEWTWAWSPSARYEPTFLIDAVIAAIVTGTSVEGDVMRTPGIDDDRSGMGGATHEAIHVG